MLENDPDMGAVRFRAVFQKMSSLQVHEPWPLIVTLVVITLVLWMIVRAFKKCPKAVPLRLAVLQMCTRMGLFGLLLLMIYGVSILEYQREKSRLVLLLDNSRSMGLPEGELVQNQQVSRLQHFKNLVLSSDEEGLLGLEDRFHIRFATLDAASKDLQGAELRQAMDDVQATVLQSELGNRLRDVFLAERGQSTVAIVFVSDGVLTSGISLSQAIATNATVPVFTIGPSFQVAAKDNSVTNLMHPPKVFAGDRIQFDFMLSTTESTVEVHLRRLNDKHLVDTKVMRVDSEAPVPSSLSDVPFGNGKISYEIEVAYMEGEKSRDNNRIRTEVEVVDQDIRVLSIHDEPSLEYRFFKMDLLRQRIPDQGEHRNPIRLTSVLQSVDPLLAESEEHLLSAFPAGDQSLEDVDVLVLGDFDVRLLGESAQQQIVRFVQESAKSIVILLGPDASLLQDDAAPIAELLPFVARSVKPLDVPETFLNITPFGDMTGVFSVSSGLGVWRRTPIYSHLAVRTLKTGVRVLAEFETDDEGHQHRFPAITFHYSGKGRVVCHAFDEFYRMRQRNQGEITTRYWLRLIRFLSQHKFLESSNITLNVQPTNAVAGDEITFSLHGADKESMPNSHPAFLWCASESGSPFRIELVRGVFGDYTAVGKYPVGNYRAWFAGNSAQILAESKFYVQRDDREITNTRPDTEALRKIAEATSGKHYTFASMHELRHDLPVLPPVRKHKIAETPYWNSVVLAILFVLLISLEWFVRQRIHVISLNYV